MYFHGLLYLYMLYRTRNIDSYCLALSALKSTLRYSILLLNCERARRRSVHHSNIPLEFCRARRHVWERAAVCMSFIKYPLSSLVLLLAQQAGLARWTRLHGKFSARLAGIRDFANCEAWDEFKKVKVSAEEWAEQNREGNASKQHKFYHMISARALENGGFFFTAGPRHRGKSSFARKRMWWPINFFCCLNWIINFSM